MNITPKYFEELQKQHPNHKCINCKHCCPSEYEDDTPASYTPYHWWKGTCSATNEPINSQDQPPKDCPFEEMW